MLVAGDAVALEQAQTAALIRRERRRVAALVAIVGRISDDQAAHVGREGARELLLGELGGVLNGRIEGRTSDDDITIFESLGIAVEDVTSAQTIVELAEAEGVGQLIDLESS